MKRRAKTRLKMRSLWRASLGTFIGCCSKHIPAQSVQQGLLNERGYKTETPVHFRWEDSGPWPVSKVERRDCVLFKPPRPLVRSGFRSAPGFLKMALFTLGKHCLPPSSPEGNSSQEAAEQPFVHWLLQNDTVMSEVKPNQAQTTYTFLSK